VSDEAGASGDPEWRERELGRVVDIKEMTTAAWNEALRASRAETAEARLAAALLVAERDELADALRNLESAVRIYDVMLNEPAAGGLMSAEDYSAYLRGAWLGVEEAVVAARAQLPSETEQARAGSDGLSHGTDAPPENT
jgi:hypothetical protein